MWFKKKEEEIKQDYKKEELQLIDILMQLQRYRIVEPERHRSSSVSGDSINRIIVQTCSLRFSEDDFLVNIFENDKRFLGEGDYHTENLKEIYVYINDRPITNSDSSYLCVIKGIYCYLLKKYGKQLDQKIEERKIKDEQEQKIAEEKRIADEKKYKDITNKYIKLGCG